MSLSHTHETNPKNIGLTVQHLGPAPRSKTPPPPRRSESDKFPSKPRSPREQPQKADGCPSVCRSRVHFRCWPLSPRELKEIKSPPSLPKPSQAQAAKPSPGRQARQDVMWTDASPCARYPAPPYTTSGRQRRGPGTIYVGFVHLDEEDDPSFDHAMCSRDSAQFVTNAMITIPAEPQKRYTTHTSIKHGTIERRRGFVDRGQLGGGQAQERGWCQCEGTCYSGTDGSTYLLPCSRLW